MGGWQLEFRTTLPNRLFDAFAKDDEKMTKRKIDRSLAEKRRKKSKLEVNGKAQSRRTKTAE